MEVRLDGVPLPPGVEVTLVEGDWPVVILRGQGPLIPQLAALRGDQERTLELVDDGGQLVGKAVVRLWKSHLFTIVGQPDDQAAIDVQGPARGGMPDGSFYPQPT